MLELAIDKFVFLIPKDLLFSEEGVWVKPEGNVVRLGLSDFLQQRSGDIAFAEVKPAGTILAPGDEVASIETVKVNLSLGSPLQGTVEETNVAVERAPELINSDPYGEGWLALLKPGNWGSDQGRLLDAVSYLAAARKQAEEEQMT
jgi:glycine cleavage system H protein